MVEQAVDIFEHTSTDELISRIQEMRSQLTEYQSEFGVDSPENLAVEQGNQTLSEAGSDQDEINPETIREWKTLRRNLAFATAALSIGNAEQFVDCYHRSTDDSVPASVVHD
jgi:hypothetical protein